MNAGALRRLRLESGMSVEALAAAAGTHGGTISRLEVGERSCTAATLRSLAEALAATLGRPVGEVLDELTERSTVAA